MRVCFDSRPAAGRRGIGRYARCLLEGLHEEARQRGGEVVEGRHPRRHDDIFHSPWMAGALLRPRVPMIVTTRAVAADAEALLGFDADRIDVIAEAPAAAFSPRSPDEVAAARRRHGVPDEYLLWVGHLGHPDPHRRVPALV